MTGDFFDYLHELPNARFDARQRGLIGFDERYRRIAGNLRLVLEPDSVEEWSRRHHGRVLGAVASLADRYPLVLFEGDVGTGKTATAEAVADRLCRDLGRDGQILKLSTRVRGQGLHGEMSRLMQEGFRRLVEEAGKRRLAFLLIDEADALATRRDTDQMHQEEKAGVNTLIQKIDELRAVRGRALVFLTTNRPDIIDPAVVRRASVRCTFERPSDGERRALLNAELEGSSISDSEVEMLVSATGPGAHDGVGFTFSDIRHRLLPEAIAAAYPDGPITFDHLHRLASTLDPAPVVGRKS